MTLCALRDVTAGYGGRPAVRNVSLEVEPGQAWVVLGPNGAGKTTLAKVAAGLLTPLVGDVTLGALTSRSTPAELAKRVAWVPQTTPSDVDFTALELALMGRAPHLGPMGLTGAHDEALAREALRAFDVGGLEARALSSLSGGEQRRVFLARALVQQAPFLVLDEPTAFLDVRHQVETLHLVRSRLSEAFGVLAVLHDVSLASQFATHAILLRDGAVIAQGVASDVLVPDRLSEVYGIAMERLGPHSMQPKWPTPG
jgi:iron complex transport system ATP-binding protein